ncbi:MAG TPA: cation:proton antiporter [Pyrinomonadaceae bacterium]|jgi:Kef-type K+ transport system membrane component KefB
MHKNILHYVIILLIFGAGVLFILEIGTRLYIDRGGRENAGAKQSTEVSSVSPPKPEAASSSSPGRIMQENLRHPLSVLLLQIIAILLAARIAGAAFRKVGQPTVVGEMIAGIILGPSLLGMLFPEAMAFLFPPQSMDSLQLLSQIGIIIFMFIVGTEVNIQHLRQHAHAAVLVSHAGIIIPFFFGAAFSLLIYSYYAPSHITFQAFALFMSVSMSITAFPVLARIIEERGISKTHLGCIAITCAAVDDVTAWCLLAAVIAIVKAGGLEGAVLTIILTLLFISLMLFLVKPQAERIISKVIEQGTSARGLVAVSLATVFASALITEVIGIHALFGAFLAGLMMPAHPRLRPLLTERLEILTASFLLPLYFAFTGLRTQIGLLNDWSSWLMCAGIVMIAIAGKLGGCALAAYWTGMNWRHSLTLGVLMNTRGLIELIVLNIGYDLGILTPRIYSMMVLMALVTTFMTGPLLSLMKSLKQRETVLMGGADVAA